MIKIRRSKERGYADHGWLKTSHTFSFADYYDPNFMGFSELRVINEDFIDGGTGFPTHPHKDMEIITYIIEGVLNHQDSMGTKASIRPGEMQRMSAGTGVRHSEFNGSRDQRCHLLQIWLLPNKLGVTPSYGQQDFSSQIDKGGLVLTVSGDPADKVITIQQSAKIYASRTPAKKELLLPLGKLRSGWLQMIEGQAEINGQTVETGDGVAFALEDNPKLKIIKDAHFLFFDLP